MSNRNSPVHTVPLELLSHIFCYTTGSLPKKLPPALLLRSVCRHWQVVAENTPELWPEVIGSYGLEWTRRALQWSKNSPFDLPLRPDGRRVRGRCMKDWVLSKNLILAERHRLRDVSVVTDVPSLDLQALLSLPLPRLESLDVNGSSTAPPLLDENVFSGQVPFRLKYLDLSACFVLPTCPVLRAPLTSLKLHDCRVWTSMDALLHTLFGLPHLETLEWAVLDTTHDEAAPFAPLTLSSSIESNPRVVHLPHLGHINLRAPIEVTTFFFTHVIFPLSCSVTVDADIDNVTPENVDELYPVLDLAFGERLRAAFPDDDTEAGFRRVELDPFQEDTLEGVCISWSESTTRMGPAVFSVAFLPLHDDDANVDPRLLSLICYMLEHWPSAHRIVSRVATSHTRLFSVAGTGSTDPEARAWARILRLLPQVEDVSAVFGVDGFAEAFAIRAPDLISPRLRYFNVAQVDLTPATFAGLMNALRGRPSIPEEGKPSRPVLRLRECFLGGVKLPNFSASLDSQSVVD